MFCSQCGKQTNENKSICGECESKTTNFNVYDNQFSNKQNSVTFSNENFFLGNKMVFYMFAVNMLLLFFGIVFELFKSLQESSANSGFFLIIIPFIAGFYSIPQVIGLVLSAINLKIKNYVMLIFIFIASLLSIWTTVESSNPSGADNNGMLFWICLISSITLSIILLLKIIFKIKK